MIPVPSQSHPHKPTLDITPSDSSSNEPIPLGVNGSLTHPITADLTTLAVQLVAEPATNVTWRSAISFSASDSTLEYSVFNLRGRAFADHPITVTPKPDREDCPSATFGYRDNKNAKVGGKCVIGNEDADLEVTFCEGYCGIGWASCGKGQTCCTVCVGNHHCAAGNSPASDIWINPVIDG